MFFVCFNFFLVFTLQLDSGKQIDVIYTDFKKAFDKVPHHALISKLRAYGLDDTLIQYNVWESMDFFHNGFQLTAVSHKEVF